MGKTSIGKQIGGSMPEENNERSITEKIEKFRRSVIDRMLSGDIIDIEKKMSALLIHDIYQLNETIKDAAATTNKLTRKIKTLNWILVILGLAGLAIAAYATFWKP